MTNKQLSLTVIIILLLLIVFGGVIYFRSISTTDELPNPEPLPPISEEDENEDTLIVTHAFDGTTHEYTGSVVIPTPCHTLETEAIVAESFPEQITINISIIAPDEDVICTQVLDRATFDLFVEASEEARLSKVVVDGKPVDFEIFEEFKG